ncbi:MAG: Eco57I restriction-modification methylase domain-containing protein, partial [Fusobacteriaceae bacterium]
QNYPSFKEWAELAKANQFFHWELEFPEVFNGNNKGFDCIIGNPPYGAKLNLILKQFFIKKYKSAQNFETEFWKTKGSLDTYSLFVDSTVHLLNKKSKFGYIVPMAIMSGDSVSSLHEVLFKKINILKISSYSSRPSRIFPNADQRVSIILGYSNGEKIKKLETTKINKRYKTASINDIIENLEYINSFEFYKFGRIPKMGKEIEINVLKKIFQNGMQIQKIKKDNGSSIFYRTSGGRYYNIITPYPTGSSKEKEIKFENEINLVVGAALSSNIFYWYQQLYTNTLDLKSFEINMFPVPNNNLTEKLKKKIIQKYEEYLIDIEKNCLIKNKKYSNTENIKEKEYSIRKSRNLILELDQLLGEAYELTNEEIEFIKNYDIKFRTDEQE